VSLISDPSLGFDGLRIAALYQAGSVGSITSASVIANEAVVSSRR
jgi:hypothetical protein